VKFNTNYIHRDFITFYKIEQIKKRLYFLRPSC